VGILVAWGAFIGVPGMPMGQQLLDIRAVVNDEAISAYDVDQRINLIIRSSNLPDTTTARRELAPRVLQSLVDEALQMQEAKRLNIRVAKKELEEATALLEKQNKLPQSGLDLFLKNRGIDKRTMMRQLEANIAWGTVVQRQLSRTITVSKEEIERALARIKANADKPRLLVAEIFIAVDSPTEEPIARQNAQKIFMEIRRGASFPLTARQFSQAASAKRGGDLGWVLPGELEPEVDKILSKLPKNTVSEPIRTASGYYIMALRNRREPPSKGDTTVVLRQVMLPVPPGAGPQEINSQKALAETIRETVRGCADFTNVTKELGTSMSGDLGRLKLTELPPKLRQVVTNLPIDTPSPPVIDEGSIRLLMVCDRRTPGANLPSLEEMRRRLTLQRLEMRARRHLRDLRDTAFLDIRA
ncbi:MAG: peptidyl-prolyl cis-trans isomerase SurA, partial [Alphaproteobacteria bacterium]